MISISQQDLKIKSFLHLNRKMQALTDEQLSSWLLQATKILIDNNESSILKKILLAGFSREYVHCTSTTLSKLVSILPQEHELVPINDSLSSKSDLQLKRSFFVSTINDDLITLIFRFLNYKHVFSNVAQCCKLFTILSYNANAISNFESISAMGNQLSLKNGTVLFNASCPNNINWNEKYQLLFGKIESLSIDLFDNVLDYKKLNNEIWGQTLRKLKINDHSSKQNSVNSSVFLPVLENIKEYVYNGVNNLWICKTKINPTTVRVLKLGNFSFDCDFLDCIVKFNNIQSLTLANKASETAYDEGLKYNYTSLYKNYSNDMFPFVNSNTLNIEV